MKRHSIKFKLIIYLCITTKDGAYKTSWCQRDSARQTPASRIASRRGGVCVVSTNNADLVRRCLDYLRFRATHTVADCNWCRGDSADSAERRCASIRHPTNHFLFVLVRLARAHYLLHSFRHFTPPPPLARALALRKYARSLLLLFEEVHPKLISRDIT